MKKFKNVSKIIIIEIMLLLLVGFLTYLSIVISAFIKWNFEITIVTFDQVLLMLSLLGVITFTYFSYLVIKNK